MKLIFSYLIFICFSASTTFAQQKNKGEAWEIILKTRVEALPNATKDEQEYAEKYNDKFNGIRDRFIISDSLCRYEHLKMDSGKYKVAAISILNRRDSIVFEGYDKTCRRTSYTSYLKEMGKKGATLIGKLHDDGVSEKILGMNTHRFSYQTVSSGPDGDTTYFTVWSVSNIPSWFIKELWDNGLKGMSLKSESIDMSNMPHLKFIREAISITSIEIGLSDYLPPKDYVMEQVVEMPGSDYPDEDFIKATSDSIAHLIRTSKENYLVSESSGFQNGFAKITIKNHTFFINSEGKHFFDKIITEFNPINSIKPGFPGLVVLDRNENHNNFIVSKNQKMGVLNDSGKWIMPLVYDNIRLDGEMYLSLIQNGKAGIADTWGKILVPPIFDEVTIMDGKNYFDVRKGNRWGIYSREQKRMALPFVYDKFDYCGGCGGEVKYVYASKNKKWGVIDFEGKALVPFEYEHPCHCGMRSDNWVTAFQKNGKNVVINMSNQKIYSASEFKDMEVVNGLLALKKNDKYALVNDKGEQLTAFVYDYIGNPYGTFESGPYIRVRKGDLEGIIRNDGKLIIPPNKFKTVNVRGHYFVVKRGKKEGLLDTLNNEVLPIAYDLIDDTYGLNTTTKTGDEIQLFLIEQDTLTGFYNPKTKIIVRPQFNEFDLVMSPDSMELYVKAIRLPGNDFGIANYGLYSQSGKEVLPLEYGEIEFISPGLLKIKRDNKKGIFDCKQGKEIVPAQYDDIYNINDSLLNFKNEGETGASRVWNIETREFVSPYFKEINKSGVDNLLLVSDSLHTSLFDINKQKIISTPYPNMQFSNGISEFNHNLARVSDAGRYGYINAEGKEIIPPKYDNTLMSDSGMLRLSTRTEDDIMQDIFTDSLGRRISDKAYSRNSTYDENPNYFQYGRFMVITDYDKRQMKNLLGVMDVHGHELVPPKYDGIVFLGNEEGFTVWKNKKFGFIDKDGKELFPPVLDRVEFGTREYIFLYIEEALTVFPLFCKMGDDNFYVTDKGKIMSIEK